MRTPPSTHTRKVPISGMKTGTIIDPTHIKRIIMEPYK